MPQPNSTPLSPIQGKARIEVLDILRGIAILGIFYINVPYMAAPVQQFSADLRSIGWSAADQNAWAWVTVLLAGTQRCLLEFLFGAGMMVLASKAMEPDGPVGVSDLYYRRNMWLLAFGLFDVFFLLWPGDILHIYALAALFLFPFRRLAPKFLVTIGLGWAVLSFVGIPSYGAREYVERTVLVERVEAVHAKQQHGQPLAETDLAALAEWRKLEVRRQPDAVHQAHIQHERRAHSGGFLPYARDAWDSWGIHVEEWLEWDVIEAFCTMLIGVALWKWGVMQGQRSTRFYLRLTLAAYGFGLTARIIGVQEVMAFDLLPRTIWFTGEFARLAVGIGHLGLIHLLLRSRAGHAALSVFKAPGRMAFSLYFAEQFVGRYILFAPFGLDLWGRYGWAEMAAISTLGVVMLVGFANLWMRCFVSGPLEWLWRSLAYVKLQPLLPHPSPVVGLNALPQPDR